MSDTIYARLVISRSPISSQPITEDARHDVLVALQYEGSGQGGWLISQSAPDYLEGGGHQKFVGQGSSISQVVLSWLTNLCGSMLYLPLYRRREEEKRNQHPLPFDPLRAAITPAIED